MPGTDEGDPVGEKRTRQTGRVHNRRKHVCFKKRNARVIGKNMEKMDEACERNNADINNNFYFGIGTNYSNADTDILNAILS